MKRNCEASFEYTVVARRQLFALAAFHIKWRVRCAIFYYCKNLFVKSTPDLFFYFFVIMWNSERENKKKWLKSANFCVSISNMLYIYFFTLCAMRNCTYTIIFPANSAEFFYISFVVSRRRQFISFFFCEIALSKLIRQ